MLFTAITAAATFIAGLSTTALIVGGAVVGAVIGGTVAAIKGENILKGALTGGLIGAAAAGTIGLAAKAYVGATGVGSVGSVGGAIPTAEGAELAYGAGAASDLTVAPSLTGAGVKAASTVAPAATKEVAKAGLLAGMDGSDKALLLSSGASFVSNMFGPDEEDLMNLKMDRLAESKKIDVVSTDRFKPELTWNSRFDKEYSASMPNAFMQSPSSHSDTHSYRKATNVAAPAAPTVAKPNAPKTVTNRG